MELLVVLGIFSLATMLSSAIFLQSNQAQRRVLATTNAQADLRFAMEAMVREVRTGRIDYATYSAAGGAVSIPAQRLLIVNDDGDREEFYLETSPIVCTPPSLRCVAIRVNGGPAQALTGGGIEVQRLVFYVSPQVDPFTADEASGLYPANRQPTVTVIMTVRTTNEAEPLTLNAETTAVARTYVR